MVSPSSAGPSPAAALPSFRSAALARDRLLAPRISCKHISCFPMTRVRQLQSDMAKLLGLLQQAQGSWPSGEPERLCHSFISHSVSAGAKTRLRESWRTRCNGAASCDCSLQPKLFRPPGLWQTPHMLRRSHDLKPNTLAESRSFSCTTEWLPHRRSPAALYDLRLVVRRTLAN